MINGTEGGLTDMVDDHGIALALSAANDPIRAERDLAGKALAAGARDNASLIVARRLSSTAPASTVRISRMVQALTSIVFVRAQIVSLTMTVIGLVRILVIGCHSA